MALARAAVLLACLAMAQAEVKSCFMHHHGYVGFPHGMLTPNGAWLISAQHCGGLCMITVDCDQFTWNMTDGACWLQNTTDLSMIRIENVISGDKNSSECTAREQFIATVAAYAPKTGNFLSNMPLWAWILSALAIGLIVSGLIFFCCYKACCGEKKKSKRSAKVTAEESTEAGQAQPLMSETAPAATYAYQPVTYSYVQNPVQAPPVYYQSQQQFTSQVMVAEPVITAIIPFGQDVAVPYGSYGQQAIEQS